MSNWTTPTGSYDAMNVNSTTVELTKAVVETADSGMYICSARVIDSSGNPYVEDSELVTNETNVVVSKFH